MTLRACMTGLALSAFGMMVATPGVVAARKHYRAGITAEQEKEVHDAVARLKQTGLPEPLSDVPDVTSRDKVLVSDAVSVVEVAHVDFSSRTFFLSVQNPWTNITQWYGIFSLDP